MSKPKNNKIAFLYLYSPVILLNAFLIWMFLQAYIRDNDVHFLFAPFMMLVWFVLNLICVFFIGASTSNKDDEEGNNADEAKPETRKFTISKVFVWSKYVAIAYINYLFISSMIELYMDDVDLSMIFTYFLIYNLFCTYFIWRTRKSAHQEFFCFIMITLPVLVGLVWYLIVG